MERNGMPPREDLVRALPEAFELRDNSTGSPTMFGHFARFDEWTEIDSMFEGQFMERVAPGAFKKTFAENGDRMRVLFQHGQDPQIGDKPVGSIDVLREDADGAYYEVPLLDAPYVRDNILPGLRAGLYGASFRFAVQREEFNQAARVSDHNPKGLPERTLKEVAVREFGPVTFPAYPGATSSVRSLTDQFMLGRFTRSPEIAQKLIDAVRLDSEDLSCLAQMIALGTGYINEQDEPGDQTNIPRMEAVLQTLTELAAYEANEDEGPEDDMASGRNADQAPPADAAPKGTSERDAANAATPQWPTTAPSVWEELWIPRI